jgi:hypothetical protein
LCEPLETTANGKRLVVEDSAACQKTIQSPVLQQVLKTDGAGNLTWTNGSSGTVLRKDATGFVEFATLNIVLQSGPVDLGSQPLTTTGSVSTGALTTTSLTSTGAASVASLASTGGITATSAVINASSSSNAVRITQTGSGAALVVEDETNPDSTPFSVQSDGKVLIGTDTPFAGSNSKLQVVGFPRLRQASNDDSGTGIACDKSRGTIDSPQIVQNGDNLAFLQAAGFNGTDYQSNARIFLEVDGVPSSVNMPGRIAFYTRETTSLTEKMRISGNGNVGIGTTTPDANAILQLNSSTKGFLPPRMTTTQKNAISTPPSGLMVYDTTTDKLCVYNGTSWIDLH